MNRDEITRHNMLVRITRLYYLCNMTQQEIADQEGLSRIKITRLLKEAQGKKIVEFKINDSHIYTLELEEKFKNAFNLRKVIILPSIASGSQIELLGNFAADFLQRSLKRNSTIGIGWGRTLNSMLPYIAPIPQLKCRVVSLTGGLSANSTQPNPYDIASKLAQRLDAQANYLLIPAIVANINSKKILLQEKKIQDTVLLWKKIDIALMSIGIITPDSGFYYSFENPQKEVEKVKELGAVGDILGRPFDINGKLLKTDFINRTISIDLDDLKKTGTVTGIAAGLQKAEAILGALRSGYLDCLITDEKTAKKILSFTH